nr:MAG TPA: hypothetical protein [Caudoviricetes sp.]
MRKSGLTGDEAYALSKRRKTTEDLGPLKKEISLIKEDLSNKITKFYASNQGKIHLADSDNGKIMDMMLYGKSSQNGTPTPENPVKIKSVVNPTVKVTSEDGLKVQFVTLNNITLSAIPVSSGGNVTIDGQQYIADYVDVERGKLVQRIWRGSFNGNASEHWLVSGEYERFSISVDELGSNYDYKEKSVYCNRYQYNTSVFMDTKRENGFIRHGKKLFFRDSNIPNFSESGLRLYLAKHSLIIITYLDKPIEIDLTQKEVSIFKKLATYYPITNISVTSEQLDGYTIFNYPISIANGWNYVKQQLNDNRDYIYDMDLQSAEAYVNSEYAAALTELEV